MNKALLLFFLTLPMLMDAQDISLAQAKGYADQLTAMHILNDKGKAALLKAIQDGSIEVEHRSTVKTATYTHSTLSKETILQFCYNAFLVSNMYRLFNKTNIEARITPEDALIDSGWTAYPPITRMGSEDNLIHATRSTIGLTRTRTLEEIRKLGLINDTVYLQAKRLLGTTLGNEVDLMEYLLKKSIGYRYYDFNLAEQREYIERLTQLEIFSTDEKERLLKSYKPQELKTVPEMLAYSSRYRLVDLQGLEADPAVCYPAIFEKVRELIPDLRYEGLRAEVIDKKSNDLTKQEIKLSFVVGGLSYAHTFFYTYKNEPGDTVHAKLPPVRVSQDFHKGINQWLTDVSSPYRLYTINIPLENEDVYGQQRVGLLLLKKGEADMVSEEPYLISRELYDARLKRSHIDSMLTALGQQGLFSHLSSQEVNVARENINSNSISSTGELLAYFPKTMVSVGWETGNLENPYEDLTKQLAGISRGAVTITGIVDEYKKGWDEKKKKVKYGFTLNGKKYEALLGFETDWLDPAFIVLLKQAVKENGIDGSWYQSIFNGGDSGYIFLTAKQFRFMKEHYPDLLNVE